MANLIFPR
ncbi:hypothetical protein F383_22868 [Gossypium arboreum]|uniref:Uncharacterized protein n=1 Tax=Gossypium arboreum TaxID=29729 RepID=A0A0B0NSV3_GOSAR|nr:hypothetical protein F383_22868 [Gossypium arboreum]